MCVCFYMVSMTITLTICNLRYYVYLHCLIHCIATIFLRCTICSIFCLIYSRVFVKITLYLCQCQYVVCFPILWTSRLSINIIYICEDCYKTIKMLQDVILRSMWLCNNKCLFHNNIIVLVGNNKLL